MSDFTMPPTPELDKQREIIHDGRAAVVQDFIDWFREQHLELMVYESRLCEQQCPGPNFLIDCRDGRIYIGTYKEAECPTCGGTGWTKTMREGYYSDGRSPQRLMADFFGIDENKIEVERRVLLDAIREAANP